MHIYLFVCVCVSVCLSFFRVNVHTGRRVGAGARSSFECHRYMRFSSVTLVYLFLTLLCNHRGLHTCTDLPGRQPAAVRTLPDVWELPSPRIKLQCSVH